MWIERRFGLARAGDGEGGRVREAQALFAIPGPKLGVGDYDAVPPMRCRG
jgi:hypothetical protein